MTRKKVKDSGPTIIVKSGESKPIFKYEPPPIFKTKLEAQRWWAEENKRWIEGYGGYGDGSGGGLPGTFYYACTQGHVKNRVTGVTSRYQPRATGLMMHEFIYKQRQAKRMGGIIKPRGVGLSTEFGILSAYFMRAFPGSTTLCTSKDLEGIGTIYKEKFLPTYSNMPVEIRPEIINKNDSKGNYYLRTQIPITRADGTGEYDIAESELYMRETSEKPDSPTNFSGKGAIFGAYDEYPLHPRRRELLRSSIECYKDPVTKELTGFLLWGGTVEAALNSEQTAQFRNLVNDSALWDCDILFIPYYMQMFLDENGHPDVKRAEEWWEKEFEKNSKKNDGGEDLRAFIRNNPRSLEDIFSSGEGSRWEDDVSNIIKEQRKNVLKEKIVYKPGTLLDYGQKISFVPSQSGSVHVLEQPIDGVEYLTLVDGVATGTESGSEGGSKVAAVVVKKFDPNGLPYQPVALYYERPKNVEQSYMSITNLSVLYNSYGLFKGIMAEANAATADHFATYLKKRGLGKFIMYRRDLLGNNKVNSGKPFHYVNSDVRDYQMRQANMFMRKYGQSVTLLPLLDQMLMSKEDNTDVLDAWLMLFLALPDNYDEPVRQKVLRRRMVRVFKKDSYGRLIQEWQTL